MRWFLSPAAAFLLASALPAHPVPKDNHDRTLVIHLTPRLVAVDYRLEIDELTAARELPADLIKGLSSRKEVHEAVSKYLAEDFADKLAAQLDGGALRFRCERRSYILTDHLRCDFRFEAPWSPQPGASHEFTFRECSYELDDFSILRVRLTADNGVSLNRVTAPDELLLYRPAANRRGDDMERLRRVKASFSLAAAEARGLYKPALPPDLEPPRAGPDSPEDAAVLKAPAHGEVAAVKGYVEERGAEPVTDEQPLPRPGNLLTLFLDTRYGFVAMLGMAFLLGSAHALTPGHGKTLVAAYLVGERGTAWHALLLGLVVTLTHTAAVLLVAALLPAFFPQTDPAGPGVQQAMGLIGGLLIAGLGFWLLLRRLAGQVDHIHLGGGHHHHHHHHHTHDHEHDHTHVAVPVSLWSLIVLGIGGGIIPCPEAIALLGWTVSQGQVHRALPTLLAFSAGLACVLVGIGIGVVYAGRYAGARWNQGDRLRPLLRALPLVSAVLVTLMGLWLCYESTHAGS
jgi:ABC-type nickel/cobalt efflux system permease component RcnA